MGNEVYQQRKDINLIPGEDRLIQVPKNIVVYLTKDQADATWKSLCDYAEKNGKVKTHEQIENCIFLVDGEKEITPNSVYGNYTQSDVGTLASLNMVPKMNDANRLAQTDKNYDKEHPDYIAPTQDFTKKIKNWYEKKLITAKQHNAIIRGILLSSGSIHNDWVYALTGEDSGREEDSTILDIHDRRIDDPNVPLTVKGGVNVGDPDNATDRKKLSVFGETELQDGTTFGRLLDTFGEQFPMFFGHLIPDQGQYHKVYINRGEDRYNAEDWDDTDNIVKYWKYDTTEGNEGWKEVAKADIPSDASIVSVNILPKTPAENTYYSIDTQIPYYGTGFGTIEAYKEIVSHTTVNADRGIIIEDGLGDRTDKKIEKTVENKENYFKPTGAETHKTNGFALSIHHDGAKIQGHTYIQDEGSANLFYKDNNIIYKVNTSSQDGFDIVDTNDIKKDCWFCVDDNSSNDWQYRHFCTNKDNDVELVVDRWYGHLYYEGACTIRGREGWKYCYNGKEYYYDGTFHIIENHKNVQPGEIFTLGNDLTTYYRLEENPLSKILEQYQYNFAGIYTDIEEDEDLTATPPVYYVKGMVITVDQPELEYVANLRVRPKTDKVYQIKELYIETNSLYSLIDQGTYSANTYLYWDGIKFKPVPDRYDSNNNEVYNQKQDYGSLTVGTRANGIQDNDTIGRNSLEVGKENEATGDNAVANGQATIAAALGSHAEGLGTEIKSTGLLSHIEGLGDYSELVEYQAENDFFGEGGGQPSEVSGIASHAEGYGQKVEGKYSHAEGRLNQILGNDTIASHAEGSENIIEDTVGTSHAEGVLNKITKNKYNEQSPVNKFATEGAHVEGAGNIIDRRYQHLEGVLAKTTHDVDQYYDDGSTPTEKPVIFAIGDGDSPIREDAQGNTPADNIVENREDPTYEKSNLFAVTEDGDTYVAGHLEVDGTSDLSGRATIGDSSSVDDHSDANPALDVLKHSRFREKVTIERDGQATADLDMTWPADDISLAVKGESLFGDTLTIGEAGDRDEETGTFWANLDETDPFNAKSAFNGLYVHGEIHNERIPQELYTSMPVGNDIVLNEFADKFFVNSSIATSTATYRGSFSAIDYNPHMVEKITGSTLTDILNNPDNYNIIECNNNLPTKYTNQFIFVQDVEKPIVFNLKKAWTVSIDIHPYEQTTYTAGYYRFYYNNNGVSQETPILDTNSKIEKSAWLKAKIRNMYNQVIEHKVNSRSDLPEPAAALENKIYYIIDEDTYCECIKENNNYKWVEIDPTANNNDYCYFQIWDRKIPEPYVLFAEQYDDDGNPLNSLPTQTEEDLDPEAEMEIICERYKFSETVHPTTGEIIKSEWKFEYQLNNSGFTQAQWAAINSGISGAWMSDIETRITNLNSYVHNAIEILQREDTKIWNNFNNYFTKREIEQNYYSRFQIEQYLNENYYTKGQIASLLISNLSNYYSKSEIDAKLQDYVNISTLNNYYTKAQIDSILGNYYTKFEIDPILNSYVTLGTEQLGISGKKNFTNPAGIGLDGIYLKKGNTNANVGPFTLPTSGSGELALKSDLDTVFGSVKNDYIVWSGLSRLENGGGTITFQKESKEIIGGVTVYTGSCTIVAPLYSKAGRESSDSITLYNVWKENNTNFYRAGGIVAEGNWVGKSMELDTVEISNENFTNAKLKIKVPVNWAKHTGILVLYMHGIKFT